MSHRPARTRVPVAAAGVALAVAASLGLGACGSSSSSTSSAKTTTTTANNAAHRRAGGGRFGGGRQRPAASGKVASISGSSMEVQNTESGQTTVSWTGSTTFTEDSAGSLSGITDGSCATVIGTKTASGITARTVSITPMVNGACSTRRGFGGGFGGGFRGGSGGPAGGAPGTSGASPEGGPPPSGSGGGASGFANLAFASGTVTATSTTGLTISGVESSGRPTRSSSTSTPATTTIPVTVASTTTYTEEKAAASTDLAVGDCVTATGSADSTGAVTATAVRITSTGNQTCDTGFGRGGAAGGAPGA